MPIKDCQTEKHIKAVATDLFLKQGKLFITTQDIADAAGVNRTLLHYYFRSRDEIFHLVFKEAVCQLNERLNQVIGLQMDFKAKIEQLVEISYSELLQKPYLETFLALHINHEPQYYKSLFVTVPGTKDKIKSFLKEIKEQMDLGAIVEMKPMHFLLNLFGLLSYPFIAKPIYTNLFEISDSSYNKLLAERKQAILQLLFKTYN